MSAPLPLISCICVTDRRIAFLKTAIKCFHLQDYPEKELVVCYPTNDRLSHYICGQFEQKLNLRIQKVLRSENATLGDARNMAINAAHGQYICIWDDDDWYHASRLSVQLNCMLQNNYVASILNQIILFDQASRIAYLSFYYIWEGTLMCHRDVFKKHIYESKHRGEDSKLLDHLDLSKKLLHIGNAPYLYIYVIHTGNTSSSSHFKAFLRRSISCTLDISEAIANQIT